MDLIIGLVLVVLVLLFLFFCCRGLYRWWVRKPCPVALNDPMVVDLPAQHSANKERTSLVASGPSLQLTVNRIPTKSDLGTSTMLHTDRLIRVEGGTGILEWVDLKQRKQTRSVAPGTVVLIPCGMTHNVANSSDSQDLLLSSAWALPSIVIKSDK